MSQQCEKSIIDLDNLALLCIIDHLDIANLITSPIVFKSWVKVYENKWRNCNWKQIVWAIKSSLILETLNDHYCAIATYCAWLSIRNSSTFLSVQLWSQRLTRAWVWKQMLKVMSLEFAYFVSNNLAIICIVGANFF